MIAADPVIRIEGLGLSFEQDGRTTEVLRGLDLTVNRGEFVAIVGSSGVGKSTLLRVLMNLARPTAGQVTIRPRRAMRQPAGTGVPGFAAAALAARAFQRGLRA